ncbi:hypothetical protein RRSWK_04819 [Rhodopirellula sp. SWK7]|nr:hypothetical protein RRSWK_04819 [Rhodopirellula sp. SWK7]
MFLLRLRWDRLGVAASRLFSIDPSEFFSSPLNFTHLFRSSLQLLPRPRVSWFPCQRFSFGRTRVDV